MTHEFQITLNIDLSELSEAKQTALLQLLWLQLLTKLHDLREATRVPSRVSLWQRPLHQTKSIKEGDAYKKKDRSTHNKNRNTC